MQLEIKTLTLTLALGATGFYGLLAILRSCGSTWSPGFLRASPIYGSILHAAVALALCFTIGTALESLAKAYTGNRTSTLQDILSHLLETDRELRTETLLTKIAEHPDRDGYRLGMHHFHATPLLHEVIACFNDPKKYAHAIRTTAKDSITRVQNITKSPEIDHRFEVNTEKLVSIQKDIDKIYFLSKNICYLNNNYYSELSEIRQGIGFFRALFISTLLLSILALICLIIIPLTARRNKSLPPSSNSASLARISLIFIICSVGAWASKVSFTSSSIDYNKRVFGYASLLVTQD